MTSSPEESIGSAFAEIPVPPNVGEWIATTVFSDGFWNMDERIDDYKKGTCEDDLWEYFNYEKYDEFFECLNDMAEYITDEYPILITDIIKVINEYRMTADDLVYDDDNQRESWAYYHRRDLPSSNVYPAIGFLKYRVLHLIKSATDEKVKWSNWEGYRKQFMAYHENKINRIKRAINEYDEWYDRQLSNRNDFNTMQQNVRKLLFSTNYDEEDEPIFSELEESDYEELTN